MKPAGDGGAAQALADALTALHHALLGPDATAIEDAARRAGAAVLALERAPPPAAMLAPLAELNRRAGVLVAARQAAANWALSRLAAGGPALYDSDGRQAAARPPRPLARA